MSTEGKDAKKPASGNRFRKALDTAAGLRAEKEAITHRVESSRDIVEAKAKAAVAEARVELAEGKRDIEKRVDDARVRMHDGH